MITARNEQAVPNQESFFYWKPVNGLSMVTFAPSIETQVVLLPVDPYLAHAYWEIAGTDLEHLRSHGEIGSKQQLSVRIYDASIPDDKHTGPVIELHLPLHQSKCYIPLSQPDRSYVAKIGMIGRERQFISLAESNVIRMPRAWPVKPLVHTQPQEKQHPFIRKATQRSKDTLYSQPRELGKPKTAISSGEPGSLSLLNESFFNTGVTSWPNGLHPEDNGCNDQE